MKVRSKAPTVLSFEKPAQKRIGQLMKASDLSLHDAARALRVSKVTVSFWLSGKRTPDNASIIMLTWLCGAALKEAEDFYAQPNVDELIKTWHKNNQLTVSPNWRGVVDKNIKLARQLLAEQNAENKITCKDSDWNKALERFVELGYITDEKRINILRRYLSEDPNTRISALNEMVLSGELGEDAESKARAQLSENGIQPMPTKKASAKNAQENAKKNSVA